jgi:hypothetical protein
MLEVDYDTILPEITHAGFIITDSDIGTLVHLSNDPPANIPGLAAEVEHTRRAMYCTGHEYQRAYVTEYELRQGLKGRCDNLFSRAENGQVIRGRHDVTVQF